MCVSMVHDSVLGPLKIAIVTVSTSNYGKKLRHEMEDDQSGEVAERIVGEAGHVVSGRYLIPDNTKMIRRRLTAFLAGPGNAIVFTGGTGVSPDDLTIEAVRPFFEKELEGFGEMLRSESYERIGVPAFLTRATAGIAQGKLVVSLPGSPDAVETALELFLGQFSKIIGSLPP